MYLDNEDEFLRALLMKSRLLNGERKPNIGEVGEALWACVNASVIWWLLLEYLDQIEVWVMDISY